MPEKLLNAGITTSITIYTHADTHHATSSILVLAITKKKPLLIEFSELLSIVANMVTDY